VALWQDLRVAARLLGRHPGFTPGAVLDVCRGITGTRADVGLTLSTTRVFDPRAWRDDHGVQERGVAESRNNSCENPRVGGSARSESG
jgi:hypothetical protein